MTQSTQTRERTYGGTEHLTESEYHEVLAVDRRRTTLNVLAEVTTPVELEDLAATVAAREDDVDVAAEEDVNVVIITLHHAHLPKLDTLGVIDYDPEARRVEY